MTNYFEQLFKQMFLQRYSRFDSEGVIKGRKINLSNEYQKILDKVAIGMIYNSFENEKIIDAMLHLTRSERIILAFHIIAEMRLAEIAFLLDTSVECTYQEQKEDQMPVWFKEKYMLKKTKFAGARTKAQMNNKGGSGDGIFFDKRSQTWGFRAVRDGKDTRKKGFATRTEAKEARIAFVAEHQSDANKPTNPYEENTTITLNEIFNHYLEHGSYDRRDGTITKQKSLWSNHIGPTWGNRTIVSISSGDLKNYLLELYYKGSVYNNYANGYAYSYVEGFLKVFYLIWGYAQSMRWISRDTYYFMCEDKNTKLTMPDKSKEDKDDEKIETYTQAEIDAMHARIENSNLHTAFLLGYFLGVRISECFGLMWSDIDWDKHTIHIQRQMLMQDSIRVLVPPKTEKADREIDIPDKLYEHLLAKKKYEQERREHYGTSYRATEVVKVRIYKDQDDDLVGGDFINRKENGEILTNHSMKSWATKFKDELGIHFKYHNLRHTHASFLAAMNCPLAKLKKRMGHSKIETTNSYYFGDNEIADEKMIQAINQLH